jgi:hypothetical protein
VKNYLSGGLLFLMGVFGIWDFIVNCILVIGILLVLISWFLVITLFLEVMFDVLYRAHLPEYRAWYYTDVGNKRIRNVRCF